MDIIGMQPNKKIYSCPFDGCTSVFDRPYRLAQHRLVHVNVKPFVCEEQNCEKAYTSKSHLDRHIKSVHKESELNILYCCPICMKKYVNRQNLKRHIKVSHVDNNKPFCCSICKLYFKKKHQLRAHMYVHNGIKPFRCPMCERDFVTLYEKKKHMRNHKTYVCEHCEMKFTRWTELMHHKRVDHVSPEYVCHDCEKVFKERGHIIRHVKKHMPNTPVTIFFCPYDNCHRHYSRNSNLKQHILVKHEGLTFDCSHCGAKLSTKAALNEHIQAHSQPEVPLRVPKTLENGRKKRNDAGKLKYVTAMKLAGIVSEESRYPDQKLLETMAKLNEHIERHSRPEVAVKVHKTLETGRKKRKDAGTIRYETAMRLAGIVKQKIEEGISRLYNESIHYQDFKNNRSPCSDNVQIKEYDQYKILATRDIREDQNCFSVESKHNDIKTETSNSSEIDDTTSSYNKKATISYQSTNIFQYRNKILKNSLPNGVNVERKVATGNLNHAANIIEILNRPSRSIDFHTNTSRHKGNMNVKLKVETDSENAFESNDEDGAYSDVESVHGQVEAGTSTQPVPQFQIKRETTAEVQCHPNNTSNLEGNIGQNSINPVENPPTSTNALSSLLQLYWRTILNYQDV